jgi:hypothetical protein
MLTEHRTMTPTRSNRGPSHHRRHRPSGASLSLSGVLTLTMILLTGAAIAPRSAHAGDITYSLANYTSDQAGHSVSGSITTDGVIGTLTDSDILSWTVTIDSTTFTSNDAGAAIDQSGILTATPTSLDLPMVPTGSGNGNDLQLFTQPGATPLDLINWAQLDSDRSPSGYTGVISATPLWATDNPVLNGTEPWVIASISTAAVPEPSSAVLAVIGAVTIVGYGASRRGGERRQTPAKQHQPTE